MHSERDGTPASGCVCNVQQMIVHAVWRFLATSTEATRLGSCSQGVCAFRALREERGGHFKSRNREVRSWGCFFLGLRESTPEVGEGTGERP